MICPTCKAEGKRSRVYVGASYSTCMYAQPYYDEDGRYHDHDPNTTSTDCSCSEGHRWQEISKPLECRACAEAKRSAEPAPKP